MTTKILTFNAHYFTKPLLYMWIINIVIINPSFFTCIIWRIYIDTINLALIFR